ncbi:MAG: sigma-70 family RNA polymerase sigma factor [Gemmataceae bacterium]
MNQTTETGMLRQKATASFPYHVVHPTFLQRDAERKYGSRTAVVESHGGSHMPDEITRDLAMRMHFSVWKATKARDERTRNRWMASYRDFRDRIVLGNRKLIFRAVRRWSPPQSMADDMIGDCQIVLIQAVSAYNPWMGIRFSTYAFTCLMRALSRISQKVASDRLNRSLPLESLPDGEPRDNETDELPTTRLARIDEFLSESNDLLSIREKRVLVRRFSLDDQARAGTLEQVGREMGLSKERVRQVQASALGKLRKVILDGTGSS